MWRKAAWLAALLAVVACVAGVSSPTARAQSTATPAAPVTGGPGMTGCKPAATPGATGSCSPFCQDVSALDTKTREDCRLSGSISRHYPLQNYGLDVNIDTSVWNPGDWVASALQTVASLLWLIAISIFDGVLTLLQWAFSLDILGQPDVMKQLKEALMTFHERILGDAWLTAALAFAALWGVWSGLVRRKAIETIGGLGATVALMILSLAIISRPDVTVLPISSIANQASMSVLSGVSQGAIDNPKQGLATSQQNLFDAFIVRPWCQLQFGDVEYCLSARKDNDNAPVRQRRPDEPSVADTWLAYPPGIKPRQELYQKTLSGKEPDPPPGAGEYDCRHRPDGEGVPGASIPIPANPDAGGLFNDPNKATIWSWDNDDDDKTRQQAVIDQALADTGKPEGKLTKEDFWKACEFLNSGGTAANNAAKAVWKDPDKVWLQGATGTFQRIALLVMTIIALLGAVLLFGYMAIRLLLARIFTLLYLLLLPVMMLAAACGRAGRGACIACLQGFVRESLLVFIYALLLAVTLLLFGLISALKVDPYIMLLLLIVFTWGLFLKRNHVTGFLSLDQRPTEGGLGLGAESPRGLGLSNLYYSSRLLGNAMGMVTAPARMGLNQLRRSRFDRAEAKDAAINEAQSQQQLEGARSVLDDQDAREQAAEARKAQLDEEKTREQMLKPRYAAQKQKLQERKEELLERKAKAKAKQPALTKNREALQERLDHEDATIEALRDRLADPDTTDQALLKDQLHDASVRRAMFQRDIDDVDHRLGEVDRIDKSLQGVDGRIGAMAHGMWKADQRITSINDQIGAADEELAAIDDERRSPLGQAAWQRVRDGDREEGRRALFGPDRDGDLSASARRDWVNQSARDGSLDQLNRRANEIRRENARKAAHERKRRKVNRSRRGLR